MIDAAIVMRARALVRRHIKATVLLGLFVGIAGGAALGTWGIARRTATSYDRLIAFENATNWSLFACPPGVDPAASEADEARCRTADQRDIVEFVRTIPGVDSAGRWSFAITAASRPEAPDEWMSMLVPFPLDGSAPLSMGRPLIVAGRPADQDAANEVVINEELAEIGKLGVGDQLVLTVATAGEFEAAGEGLVKPTGMSSTMDIVGIVRRPGDLTAQPPHDSLVDNLGRAEATRAWADLLGDDYARYGTGVVVSSSTLSADDIVAAAREHWPGRLISVEFGPTSVSRDPASVVDAIDLQSVATHLLALVIGLAALVFAGQAVSRQSRREWADADTLDALGMTRPGMVRAALVRAVPMAAVAMVIAVIVAITVSPLGPVGVARKAEPYPGMSVDPLTLVVGLPIIAVAVLACAAVPVARRRIATPTRAARSRSVTPTFDTGLAMTRSRRSGGLALGSAIAGVAVAVATGVAAWGITSSYDSLTDTPVRYGAAWDALVGNVSTDEQHADVTARLAAIPGIRAARILSQSDAGGETGFTIIAGVPLVGEKSFGVVTRGRPPATSDEAALGRETMRALGIDIGDEVTLPPGGTEPSRQFDVVGEVVVNDGFEAAPGLGALVTPEAFASIAPNGDGSTYAVWVDDEADRSTTLAAVRDEFPTTYVEPRPTDKIANLRLVASQPQILAIVVGLLAGAALVHALVMSVRRSRRQIGVLKTLGFTRRQVVTSVGWHATTIAALALIAGIPLGIIGGRLAWNAISDSLGLRPDHALPLAAIAIVAVIAVVVANIAALAPGVVAARTRPSSALRAE